ncbi:NapC/NirT family cytochrome c [Thermincola potens]|uniref:NapC/NirT cytochrome c domain protein n=1 Tax=Thermincola potens (strain JR) TaxID=635013 RepID=D5XEB1_THEPJ|nr:NapC/NirT family cytochrome c [Thermincola potens]ADG81982.1 NapC/NirT cytochrome c domain protein [Thermincola potens JR]
MKLPQWSLFKKLDLSKTEDRLKLFILVAAVCTFMLIAVAGAIRVTMEPSFCGKCHVMRPEYVTWEASSHVQVACTDCHIKPGLGNLIIHKIAALKELALYFTNTYDRPIKMSHKLPDEVCTQCHSTFREYTPSGDLIIPHERHAGKGVKCVECHSGVAHGNIVRRGLTKDGNYAAWTTAVGKQQMAKDFTEPKMNVCMDCHSKRRVTNACEACHTSITMPPDHKVKGFGVTHGKLAKKDISYCNKCHSYAVAGNEIPGVSKVAEYARGNSFCYNCHMKRPDGHTEDWRVIHKRSAKNNVDGCLVCHNNTPPRKEDLATPTYCQQCHGAAAKAETSNSGVVQKSGVPQAEKQAAKPGNTADDFKKTKAHPPGWRKQHPQFIKTEGIAKGRCFSCHDTTNCSRCHTGTN